MSYIVTGGAGFVGSNMVKKLNEKGITDIIIIDSYGDEKMKNLLGLKFSDFVDYQDGLKVVADYLKRSRKVSSTLAQTLTFWCMTPRR